MDTTYEDTKAGELSYDDFEYYETPEDTEGR